MTPEQHKALVNSLQSDLAKFLAQHMSAEAVVEAMKLAGRMTERAHADGVEFGAARERVAAQLRPQI